MKKILFQEKRNKIYNEQRKNKISQKDVEISNE